MIKIFILTSLLNITLVAQINYKTLEGTHNYTASIDGCQTLGKEWRLGEIWELFYLKGETKKFDKTKVYWSATSLKETDKHTANKAYTFYLKNGTMQIAQKANKKHVICTNLPKISQTQQHFKKTNNGVVDNLNKVVWEKVSKKRLNKKLSFEDAQEFCEDKTDEDRVWRLPTLNELYSIVNYNYVKPSLNTDIFPTLKNKHYWTNDTLKKREAYMVGFKLGLVVTGKQNHKINFLCISEKK